MSLNKENEILMKHPGKMKDELIEETENQYLHIN